MSRTLSNMEKMIEKFLELDVNRDGAVTKEELQASCRKDGLNEADIEKFMHYYDIDLDGKVSLEEFCRGLGLRLNEMQSEREEQRYDREGWSRQVDPKFEIIASTMSRAKQIAVTEYFDEITKDINDTPDELNNVATKMKDFLDEKFSRVWQVVLVKGSYFMKFSHEPFMSMQFKMGPYICLLWRTPCQ